MSDRDAATFDLRVLGYEDENETQGIMSKTTSSNLEQRHCMFSETRNCRRTEPVPAAHGMSIKTPRYQAMLYHDTADKYDIMP